uniref:MHD1 domain-containing protein n=1 Tax=Oryza barthii TaxID=65489 RepID=A0A0D3FDK8_9ORYZ
MSCRAAGGGRLNYFPAGESGGGDVSPTIGAGPRGGTGMSVVNSRVKRALGLKARRSSQPTTARVSSMNASSAPGSPGRAMWAMSQPSTPVSPGKGRRPMTSAEIMRQQMRVTEQNDARLRKTLMRTLIGQVGRKAETIVLPLELLRQVKLTDFADSGEHHQWQRRQLKLLEAGLIAHPSLPHDRLNAVVLRFREVMQAADARAIDTGKTSDAMQALCNAVHALAWRSAPGSKAAGGDACHWADGYPLNVLLYVSLLQAIFDLKEETVVLDEVDELLELMRRTWPTLGINKMLHNVCFAWVLFQQYVVTGQIEPDLAGAALAMLTEVAADAKQESRDPVYARVLSSILATIHDWSEKRMLGYHEWFGNGNCGAGGAMAMEGALSLALATTQIISDNAIFTSISTAETEHEDCSVGSFAGDRVDYYVRCSTRSAFTKILENGLGQGDSLIIDRHDDEDPGDILARLAGDTEHIALSERDAFGPVLRRWHPFPGAVTAVTLHGCFGVVLKQYLGKATGLSNELVHVLHAAGRLEKALVQMVVEDVADSDDGGKSVVREVVPYDVESIVFGFLRTWVEERLKICRECMLRAKETESWMPRSKNEPYAQSAVELMKLAKATVDEFFGIPVPVRDDLVQDLADGMEAIFLEYISFLTSCGSKQSYLPSLPPLTRCNQDSKIIRLWKKAATPCRAPVSSPRAHGHHQGQGGMASGGQNPRPSTSRGTQRLYVRLNTLHFILSHVHALDKSLSFFSRGRCSSSPSSAATARLLAPCSHFAARAPRRSPRSGTSPRSFTKEDHGMVEEDFRSLKRAFCTRGEGVVTEEVVDGEAEAAESVVALMGQTPEQLVEELSIACELNGTASSAGQRMPLPETTWRWSRTDPDTILRVLCHRDDEVASHYLKRAFQLPKRR